MLEKSWQLGSPGSPTYRLYDALRRRLNRRLVRFLAQNALDDADQRVLEAGSGPGYATTLFAEETSVRLSVALDRDIEALRQGGPFRAGRCAVVGDLEHLPFRDDSFDLVWNSSTLEHLDTQTPALAEMARITRPERWVFVGVPYMAGPLGFQRWIANTAVGIWIGTVFSAQALAALLTQSGLEPGPQLRYFLRFFVGRLARKPR